MSTQYQNWQNASNTTEQYLTAAMMLERAEADDVLMEAFKEFPHDAKSGRSLRMPRWAVPAVNTTPVSEGINNAIRNMAGLLARAFNEADPTTTITAIKAANYIVASDSDKITVGTTNPTIIQHNNTTSTTTITPDASGSLTVAGTLNATNYTGDGSGLTGVTTVGKAAAMALIFGG